MKTGAMVNVHKKGKQGRGKDGGGLMCSFGG
jgi:hypothetical protein